MTLVLRLIEAIRPLTTGKPYLKSPEFQTALHTVKVMEDIEEVRRLINESKRGESLAVVLENELPRIKSSGLEFTLKKVTPLREALINISFIGSKAEMYMVIMRMSSVRELCYQISSLKLTRHWNLRPKFDTTLYLTRDRG